MGDTSPETSTVRSALSLVGAFDDLIRPGREGSVLDADTAVEAVSEIIAAARELRPHQVTDVLTHLDDRVAAGALSSASQPIAGVVESTSDRFGHRVEDGGVWGTIVRCQTCGGSGELHDPDERPPLATPEDADPVNPWMEPEPDDLPGDDRGKSERATVAVDELVARVNEPAP